MRFLVVPVIGLSLLVGGCETLDRFKESVFKGGLSITATVQNPVSREQHAAVEASYNVAAKSVVRYGRLRRCGPNETASVTNVCAYSSVVAKLKAANRKTFTALKNLREFMKRDQISAITAYNDVTKAIEDFKDVARTSGLVVENKP